jgi:hypothetical protein
MQSAAKHLAWLRLRTLEITAPREMLRCALHDRIGFYNYLALLFSSSVFSGLAGAARGGSVAVANQET